MSVKTSLNISPYFDDYDIRKKYYRILFKPGYALQARELTQLQTTLQNQIQQFGENIYKEGSIIKGCSFTELNGLKYVKIVDGITPENYIERTVQVDSNTTDEYYYELEDSTGLKALIIQASNGFQSNAPDLNTFFIVYLNSIQLNDDFDKKEYVPNDTLSIREYILRTQFVNGVETETILDNGIVATTSVAGFSSPIGSSFGLNVSEGIIFQSGHFLFVDNQTIVVKKYLNSSNIGSEPNGVSVGYVVDESILTYRQDSSLLDNANGSPNENAPGADRLRLTPRLVARDTIEAEADTTFFILRRYEDGSAVETRDVTQFNSIATELARRTHETNGDYTQNSFKFEIITREDDFFVEMGPGTAYSKGYRISNDTSRYFYIPPIENTKELNDQPINFNYGSYVKVVEPTGRFTMGKFQRIHLLDEDFIAIGSAYVKNYLKDRLYLFGIRMNPTESFSDVVYARETDSLGTVEIIPKLYDTNNSSLIFDSNIPFVKEISDLKFAFRRGAAGDINGDGELTLAPPVNVVFDSDTLRDLLVVSNATNTEVTITSAELLDNGNLFLQTTGISETATVYHNAKRTSVDSKLKQLLSVYVKITYTDLAQTFSLGLPDVVDIISIHDEDLNDYTDSFKLNRNQKNDFYDISYLEKIGAGQFPADTTVLTVNLEVLKAELSTGLNIFTVNSYDGIDLRKIPNYINDNGTIYDLKSCIDFRPQRIPLATYALSANTATLIANTTIDIPDFTTELFTDTTYIAPASDTSASLDIEYYASRVDHIVGSSYGRFKYMVGPENGIAALPDLETNTIVAEIRIPGYPLLHPMDAFRLEKLEESPKIISRLTQTYTMKDIDDLSKKIDNLTYYATLSALEASTTNLLIQDENGLNRFKNGIIADPFNDLMIADATSPKFNASIDTTDSILNPSITTIPFNLVYKENVGAQIYNDVVATIAPNTLIPFLGQKYATNIRTCTSNVYNYRGKIFLSPNYNVAYNTTTTPVRVNVDLAKPFIDYTKALSEFVPLTKQQTSTIKTTTDSKTKAVTSTIQQVTSSLKVTAGKVQNTFVGDFITDINFQPFMKSTELKIQAIGLRPNTRHYFFFDKRNVNINVAPGSLNNKKVIVRNGAFGSAVRTNSKGELLAIFKLPANTFLVGERELAIVDINSLEDFSSAGSSAGFIKYNAYNFNVKKSGLTMSVRPPIIDISTNTSTHNVVTRPLPAPKLPSTSPAALPIIPGFDIGDEGKNRPNPGDFGYESMSEAEKNCPIAQTFFIKSSMTQGADALYLGRLDLFFNRKSTTNGVTIMIREVENGYPGWEILPFGQKHLEPEEVNVSNNASIPTSIIFDAPVRLEAEKEYCIVVKPDFDDPDYLIYVSRVGGSDILTGAVVNSDWGEGVLFTSTNNRAWKSYQDEDFKFILHRYNFNVNNGTVELETDDLEFLEIKNRVGLFEENELIYKVRNSPTYTVVLDTDNISATGTGLNNYSVGDYIYVEDGFGNKELLKILEISIDGTSVLFDRFPTISGTINSKLAIAGNLLYQNPRKPSFIVLEKSSSRASNIFQEDDVIRGIESNTIAEIDSIENIELSYIQSMINRISDSNHNIIPALKVIDPLTPESAPYVREFNFESNHFFNERGCIIFSKSNDVDREKNLKVQLRLNKEDFQTTTPVIDIEAAKLFAYIYNVSNDSETCTKYISKRVDLREGFDAEDFRLYVTGYRPRGTNIKAYIQIKNEIDTTSIENNPWIEMNLSQGQFLFSNRTNLADFKEFVFDIPNENKIENIVTYSNNTGSYLGYRSFIIRIDMLAENVANVPRLLDYRGIAFE